MLDLILAFFLEHGRSERARRRREPAQAYTYAPTTPLPPVSWRRQDEPDFGR